MENTLKTKQKCRWLKIKELENGKLSREVLTEEDIKALAGATNTPRDKAFVLSFYESGCRIGEFLPLKLRHLSFDRYGVMLRVTGMAGDRRIKLVASTLAIQCWLNEHPNKNDPKAYLWCNHKKNSHLTYRHIRRFLDRLVKKARIKKSVNPHSFRCAKAAFMARHLKEPEISEFFGWNK